MPVAPTFRKLAVPLSAAMLLISVGLVRPVSAQGVACAVGEPDLAIDLEEGAAIEAINAFRAQAGLPALLVSDALNRSAAWKAGHMARTDQFSHNDGGRSWSERVFACGYPTNTVISENIAAGYATGQATVDMWIQSGPHATNMLSPTVRAIGIARAQGGSYGWYWAVNFGSMLDAGTQ